MEAGVLAILVWLCSCTCRMPGQMLGWLNK